jgi:hypothetical protein
MKNVDVKLDRLLRSAALASEDASLEAPFGFDTRVVALWRAGEEGASLSLARFIRRVAFVAAAVTIVAGAGAYRESNQSLEKSEPFANEFAIADSAIQDEFLQ